MEKLSKNSERFSMFLSTIVFVLIVLSFSNDVCAEEKRPGLFSQMNNWLAKLRGGKEPSTQNMNQDDKQKDDKKEETTTHGPINAMGQMYPPMMFGMGHPAFNPMAAPSHYPGMMGLPSSSPFFAPMTALSSHQFAAHQPPNRMLQAAVPSTQNFNPFVSSSMNMMPSGIFNSYSPSSQMLP